MWHFFSKPTTISIDIISQQLTANVQDLGNNAISRKV